MPPVSAVCMAQDAAGWIGAAVAAVRPWVDEVIVLDGGSTDGTAAEAEAAGARVVVHPFDGHTAQRRRSLALAVHDRVFVFDADEEIDARAGAALRQVAGAAGWRVRRRNWLDGRPVRASGWAPDWQLRLVDRRRAGVVGRDPHDRLLVDGPVGALPGLLDHDRARTVAVLRQATRRHAERAAATLLDASPPRRIAGWRAPTHAVGHLLRKVVLQAAWLDGRRGWQIAWIGAGGVHRKYALAARGGRG